MTDLHSHILPGIDDGPKTLEESIVLAREYEKAGFKQVVATPHWISGTAWMSSGDEVLQKVCTFNQALKQNHLPIEVYAGQEIAMDNSIAALLQQKQLLSLAGGGYVLVESPFQRFPWGWQNIFFAILSAGYRILLAHPERCHQLIDDFSMVKDILKTGVYLQVNADSFLGRYGREVQKTAVQLVSQGHVHCLATDSHDPVHRSPRHFKKALELVERYIGSENLNIVVRQNPELVLASRDLIQCKPAHRRQGRKIRWKFW
jgi:protein-tyrosine phosphatase